MADRHSIDTSVAATEAQIAVHWKVESYCHASPKFIGQANLSGPEVMKKSSDKNKNFPECFRDYADLLT